MATSRRSAAQLNTAERASFNADTERWLSPMLVVLLLSKDGGAKFARITESMMIAAVIEAMLDDVSIGARSLDWLRLGQLVRAELGWDHYPAVPPRRFPDGHGPSGMVECGRPPMFASETFESDDFEIN
jgi:hypothetical protein